jgi:hypothetical protein
LLQDFVSQKSKPSFNETPESYQQIAQLLDDTLFQFKHHSDLATEYTQKHPELVSFKQPVMLMAAQLMREANAMGKPMTDREAIDQAVLTMQGHLASHVKGMQQKQQGDAMKRQALSFNVGQQGKPVNTSMSEQLQAVGDDDAAFAKLKASFLKSKGLNF